MTERMGRQVQKKRLKKPVVIFLPIILLIGAIIIYQMAPIGKILNASNQTSLFKVAVDGEDITDKAFVTEKEKVKVQLTVKEAGTYKLPYDEESYRLERLDGDIILPYYEITENEFDLSNETILSSETIENNNQTTESSEITSEEFTTQSEPTGTEIQTPTLDPLPESAILKISDAKKTSKGYFYLKLGEGDSVLFNVQWTSTKEQTLVVTDATDKEKEQTLFTFGKIKEVVKESSETNPIEPKKENKKETDSNKTKGMEVSIAPLELKGGADVVRLKDPKLTIQTGEKNFDPDDDPGHDSSPNNDIVRTWDKVTYAYSFSVESSSSSKTYKDIKYRVDAEFKDSRKKVNGQLRDYAYFPEGTRTGNNAAETRNASYTTSGNLSSSSSIVDSVINLQVLGATHDYELAPTIIITILEVTDVDTGERIAVNASSGNMVQKNIKVSAKPNVKATLATSTDYQLMSTLTNDSSLNAMAKTLGVKFSVVPLTDLGISRTGGLYEKLFGATYPVGETKVKIDTSVAFTSDDGAHPNKNLVYGVDQKQPQIALYALMSGQNDTDHMTKTSEFSSYSFENFSINGGWNMPGSVDTSAGKNGNRYVYNTNSAIGTNTSISTINFSVNNAAAIHNPDLLTLDYKEENGEHSTYASVGAVMSIPYDYLLDKNGNIVTKFSATTVSYEGKDYKNDSVYNYSRANRLPGTVSSSSTGRTINKEYIGSNKSTDWLPSGDGAVYTGQKIMSHCLYEGSGLELKYMTGISVWNANVYEYDNSRSIEPYITNTQSAKGKINKVQYGVKKDGGSFPGLNSYFETLDNLYNWYDSYDAAISVGIISGVKIQSEKTGIEAPFKTRTYIPLKIISENHDFCDSGGNANIIMSAAKWHNVNRDYSISYPPNTSEANFKPSVYTNSSHTDINLQSPMTYGETLAVVPFTARITKAPIRTSYNSDEVVQWKLSPQIEADDDDDVTFTIKDTLPKELTYISGSTKYGAQEIEPVKKDESDGSTSLTWTIPYHKENAPTQVLTFDTMVNGKNIKYDATNTKNVINKAVITAENKNGLKDESSEKHRTADASTTITKVSTTVIEKSTSTSKIEVGTTNPVLTDGERDTTIHYSLYNKNESKSPSKDTVILDVFPYASDGRGTTFSGSFDLLSVNVTSVNKPKIYYSKQPINSSTDPNDIDTSAGWSVYNGSRITDVKAIYLKYDQLDVGEENTLEISLVAKNQKAKEILVNSAKLDNYNYNPVQSVFVKSAVIARSIKGVAWYDDNLDGKKNPTETMAPNIPVKLYRTSHENGAYKNELVKANLTGRKFIDDSGNSSIKTSSTGDYEFDHLPEGDYVVYFEIGDDVVAKKYKVTKKDSVPTSQSVDTSKADLTTYKTDSYETPTLTGGNFPDNEWKVQNINIGLVRSSTIRLFKYATGTAIDANDDGKLSEAEKATGTPLKEAEFDIYKGDLEEKLGSAKTDETGHLEFKPLFEGEYTLVETKAPEGYELIKSPIKVTITEGNQTIQVYQEDDKKTDLPFTGGTGPMLLLLIIVSGMGILGLGGLYWYYRQPSKKGEG